MNQTLPAVFIFGVLFAISASPQDTAVAELSKEDSAKASELYKRLKAAEQEWAGGIEFSTDFRFIVPTPRR